MLQTKKYKNRVRYGKIRYERNSKRFKSFEGCFLPMGKVNKGLSVILLERFLDSKIGCEWDAVYSEICIKFGKKIVKQHLAKKIHWFITVEPILIKDMLYAQTPSGLEPLGNLRNYSGKRKCLYVESGTIKQFNLLTK